MAGGSGGRRGVGGGIGGGGSAGTCLRASCNASCRCAVGWWRRRVSRSRRCLLAVSHVSCHRSLQTPLRKASIEFTFLRSHRIPVPLRRASTTSLLALSTIPEPIGQPAWRKVGYCIRDSRLRKYPRCSRTSSRFFFGQTIGQACQCSWSAMFEQMPTPFQHL
jgi:hypothetical protein